MKTTLFIITAVVLLTAIGVAAGPNSKGPDREKQNTTWTAIQRNYRAQTLDEQRKLAATTIFRLGECYRKLGKTNEATAQYQRVVREFSDQDVLAKLSQQNLNALGTQSQASPRKPELLQVALPDEETTEIDRLRKMIKDSPDGQRAQDRTGRLCRKPPRGS